MNKQKWLAGLTAVLCSAGALSCFPAISGTVSAAELVSNDFEVNYGGWHGNDDAVALTAEDGIGRNTSRGMSVTGRTSTSDGASAEKGFYLSGGETYTYSVWANSEDAPQIRHPPAGCGAFSSVPFLCRSGHGTGNGNRTDGKTDQSRQMDEAFRFLSCTGKQRRIPADHHHRQH